MISREAWLEALKAAPREAAIAARAIDMALLRKFVTRAVARRVRDSRLRHSAAIKAGVARARASGRAIGRPRMQQYERMCEVNGLSHRRAALVLGVSVATIKRWRRLMNRTAA